VSCLHDMVERPDRIRQIVQDILEEGPFGHLLVLMDGATTTEAAPPFAIFEGWVPRTMASVLGGQYLSLHVLQAAVTNE
jgi:hypothetical protein